jgi:hypothetical protein
MEGDKRVKLDLTLIFSLNFAIRDRRKVIKGSKAVGLNIFHLRSLTVAR